MPLLIIARLTLHEAARRRLVLAVFLLTALIVSFTAWGFSRIPTLTDSGGHPLAAAERTVSEVSLLILIAWMFSVVLAMGAAFLAAPAIAGDIESGLVLAMLPRPIRRGDLLLGKWLGLAALLMAYTAAAAALELGVIQLVCGYAPPHALAAVCCLIGESLVVLSLAMLASTRLASITGGTVVIVLFGISWIAGVVATLGVAFDNRTLTTVGTAIGLVVPTDSLWRGAVYNLEPAAMAALASGFARQGPFFVTGPPSIANLLWALGWMIAVLAVAVWSFGRRDL